MDVLEESRIDDCWNVDADRNLSDSWQDSRNSLYWAKNFPKDACGPVSAWQRFKQPPDQIMCGLEHGLACQKQLRKKASMGHLKKPKLDDARKLRDIYFIDPENGEYDDTI